MQTSARSKSSHYKELFIAIFLGLIIGAVTTLFIKGLERIEVEQASLNATDWPAHLFFIPVVLIFLHLLKKRTLYFPTKIADLTEAKDVSVPHWNPLMSIFQFFGTLASHIAGVSVGREGSAVLMSSGIVRAFRLNWNDWGPIAFGCGFSAIVGQPWIGVIFASEILKTSSKQKLNIIIASLFANLLMQTLQVRHLISAVDIQDNSSYFQKLFFILSLAASCGFIMRFYKWLYFKLLNFFKEKSFYVKVFVSILLMGLLFQPQFRRYQSLGILQLADLHKLELGFHVPLIKLSLTLVSICLGFWGGEFIPLIYSGLHFGVTVAGYFGMDQLIGAYLSGYLFFAGATRLKWTSFFLILALMGWSWTFWILFLVNLTIGFSGSASLYKNDE